jgi:hypothetical protein
MDSRRYPAEDIGDDDLRRPAIVEFQTISRPHIEMILLLDSENPFPFATVRAVGRIDQ